jgi:hypothetical protein
MDLIYLAMTTPVKNFPDDVCPCITLIAGGQAHVDDGIPHGAHPGRGAA